MAVAPIVKTEFLRELGGGAARSGQGKALVDAPFAEDDAAVVAVAIAVRIDRMWGFLGPGAQARDSTSRPGRPWLRLRVGRGRNFGDLGEGRVLGSGLRHPVLGKGVQPGVPHCGKRWITMPSRYGGADADGSLRRGIPEVEVVEEMQEVGDAVCAWMGDLFGGVRLLNLERAAVVAELSQKKKLNHWGKGEAPYCRHKRIEKKR